ncbi:major capsid protein, partial [Escherichia coli]
FTTEKVYLSQIPGLVNMALYVSPIVSGEVIRSRGGSTSEFTPGYVKPKHEVNPQMTLRRLPDEDPQNLADPAYRRRRIIMQNMRDEELAIAQVEEMQAVSAVLKGKYTMTGEAFDPVEVDNASARYPKNWVTTGDPAREFTMIQSAPLMLLADPDEFVSVQLA